MADSFGLKIGLEGEKEFKKALAFFKFLSYFSISWKSNPYANVKQGRSTKT